MTVPFTNGVSAERGTSRLRHRWHRLQNTRRLGLYGQYQIQIEASILQRAPRLYE